MKKLSVIITHYKETEEQCFRCFKSLDDQLLCNFDDFEFILVNDCGVKLSDEYLQQFKNLKINHISTKVNGCCSGARQAGMEVMTGEYLTFIDIDDYLYNDFVLFYFISELYPMQANVYVTNSVEIFNEQNCIKYVERKRQSVPIHGKFYKHQFLIDKNINQALELRLNEDVYWHFVIFLLAGDQNVHFSDFISYVYFPNVNSLTRLGELYGYAGQAAYVRGIDLGLEECIERCEYERICEAATYYLVFFYYEMSSSRWFTELGQKWIIPTEMMLSYFITKWESLWSYNIDNLIEYHYDSMKLFKTIPNESFPDWYNRIRFLNVTTLPNYSQSL